MTKTCPHCQCTEIDEDAARGDSTCMGCGTVLEESTIVSDVQFAETGGGGHSLIGQFVSSDGAQPNSMAGVRGIGAQESREVTLLKGKRVIQNVASQLRINQHCMDTAFNFFKMSVSRGLTRGRMRVHVVTACLYMTCRIENTPHLLLDFSDVTQVNVYELGKTFNFLSRSLRINLPPTDPCLYVMRFASLLKFGDKEKDVVTLATRLVQRMKRDWMALGRRPTGVCGAALLLSARSNNFNRTVTDIVRVVHVGEAVVRKRLEEFSRTASSNLTVDEFATVDLEHSEDPPAFREARQKVRLAQQQQEDAKLELLQSKIEVVEAELERALEVKRRERFRRGPYARLVAESLLIGDPELAIAEDVVREEMIEDILAVDTPGTSTSTLNHASYYGPTLESLGISSSHAAAQSHENLERIGEQVELKHDGNLDLTGIDDDEIDGYILSEPETALKTRVWMKNNGAHLEQVEEKHRIKREQEEKDRSDPQKRKRARKRTKREPIIAATAAEAIEKVIQEKKLSNKINYEVLKNLSTTLAVKHAGDDEQQQQHPPVELVMPSNNSIKLAGSASLLSPKSALSTRATVESSSSMVTRSSSMVSRRRSIRPTVQNIVAAKRSKNAA